MHLKSRVHNPMPTHGKIYFSIFIFIVHKYLVGAIFKLFRTLIFIFFAASVAPITHILRSASVLAMLMPVTYSILRSLRWEAEGRQNEGRREAERRQGGAIYVEEML